MNSIGKMDEARCFACSACVSICPKSAIQMVRNEHGFLIPSIDNSLCVNCGMCKSVCPALNDADLPNQDIAIYAFQNPNTRQLFHSTSGGIFAFIIDRLKPKYVCGCISDNNQIKHTFSEDTFEIKRMMKSKYVQSDLRDGFARIYSSLERGDSVVFSGASCQVHGLMNFLRLKNAKLEKLLTLDFVCHGVPSPGVYSNFIAFYEKKKNHRVVEQQFRSKKYGWGDNRGVLNYIQSIITDDGFEDFGFEVNIWQNVFFSDLCTRECCFSCPYATVNKPSMITMGDFWGISYFSNGKYDKGCSLAIIRDKSLLPIFDSAGAVKIPENLYQSVCSKQPRLLSPTKKPMNYELFWRDYEKLDFHALVTKYFGYTYKNKILFFLLRICLKFRLFRLSRILSRRIFI